MQNNLFSDQNKVLYDQDTLFYDGNCPICLKEINHLKSIANLSLAFANIWDMELSETERETLLSQLHVKTASGEMLTGFIANIHAWQHTRYGPILTIWRYAPLRWAGNLGYRIWLWYYQYQKSRCSIGSSKG